VYSSYLYKNAKINLPTLNYVIDVFDKVWPKYDHVFYIEPEFDMVNDGTRSVDTTFRDQVVDIFDSIIERRKLTMHRVKGSVRNRVNTIMDFLEGR